MIPIKTGGRYCSYSYSSSIIVLQRTNTGFALILRQFMFSQQHSFVLCCCTGQSFSLLLMSIPHAADMPLT
jgi:hypothetical protein